ncbi:hypothetical protein [Desulfospira joergensenii]|uniref:hypothetical protein n=1 Tax=Desulfospira joergensenii TaxID=53329 RepID=UPI0003B47555|nr:hypothetical protein [Desulfospira joergensenii]
MNHIEEAEILIEKLGKAQAAFSFKEGDYEESEVLFRLKAIEGMLIMASNDAKILLKFWLKEQAQIELKDLAYLEMVQSNMAEKNQTTIDSMFCLECNLELDFAQNTCKFCDFEFCPF